MANYEQKGGKKKERMKLLLEKRRKKIGSEKKCLENNSDNEKVYYFYPKKETPCDSTSQIKKISTCYWKKNSFFESSTVKPIHSFFSKFRENNK